MSDDVFWKCCKIHLEELNHDVPEVSVVRTYDLVLHGDLRGKVVEGRIA